MTTENIMNIAVKYAYSIVIWNLFILMFKFIHFRLSFFIDLHHITQIKSRAHHNNSNEGLSGTNDTKILLGFETELHPEQQQQRIIFE